MKKINVLEVIGGMNMGGAETFLMNVLRNIDKKKFQLFFLVYGDRVFDYESEIKKLGGIIIRIDGPKKYFDFKFLNDTTRCIKDYNIDVVHSHTYLNSMYAVLAAKKAKVKNIIVHSHTTAPSKTRNIIKKIYYRFSKYIINKYGSIFLACGVDAGKSLFYKRNNFDIIDNGIIVERFKYSVDIRNKKRAELGIPNETICCFHVGRIDRNKNHAYLINVFNEFKKRNPDSKLILVGDGVLKKDIVKKVNDLGLKDSIVFLGKRRDVNELFSAMDILLFPSIHEGLPVTMIEAQANGIPIIASSNIDKDADFTNTVEFLPIDISCKKWADMINEKAGKRFHNYKTTLRSKYNMKKNVSKLEHIYECCYGNGDKKEIDALKQKELLLDMLKYIDGICRKHNIKYSLIGGSLIGAVRHHGFIPWDDDVDIILTQENYQKLKDILDAETGIYQTPRNEKKNNGLGYFKLIDTRTQISEGKSKFDPDYGIFIDISRYCQTSNNEKKRTKHFKQLKLLLKLATISKFKTSLHNKSFVKYIRQLAGKGFVSIIGHKGMSRMYRRVSNKYYGNSDSKYVINCWPVYDIDKEIQLKKNTEEYIDVKFEDLTVMIFKNYDELLRTTFGDYMKLPPKPERKPKHELKAWWKDGYYE